MTKRRVGKSSPKTYKGKSLKFGGGGRWAKGEDKLEKEGYSAKSADKILAVRGVKAHGKKAMARVAKAARRKKRKK